MDCTVIGDVFFDITVNVDQSMLRLVRGGVTFSKIMQAPGGIGNVAVGLSRIGGKAQLVGKAGKDWLGYSYQSNLIDEGVASKLLFDPNHQTGLLLNFVEENGERSFLVSKGANKFLLPSEICMHEKDIANSNFIFVCGFSLVNAPQREAIMKAVQIAKDCNLRLIFDPGSYNLIMNHKSVFEKVLVLSDTVVLNLAEATAFTGLDEVGEIIRSLSKKVPLVALKLGENGCIITMGEEKYACPINKVKCVDSTGAGDAFSSALIYGLNKSFSIKSLAKFATWYSSCVVKSLGSRCFPSRNDIQRHLVTLTEEE